MRLYLFSRRPGPLGTRFTRFARIMSSRGFADARSRQGPPPDIKLQSAAEKAHAKGLGRAPEASSSTTSIRNVLFADRPGRGPARGAHGGWSARLSTGSSFPLHSGLSLKIFASLDRKDLQPISGVYLCSGARLHCPLHFISWEGSIARLPLPHISCGSTRTPYGLPPLKHGFKRKMF